MIILSGVLVVIAIALLVAGIVVGETGGEIANLVDGMTVIYMSIAVSIVSFLCLLVGVFLRRKELLGPAVTAGVAARGTSKRRPARHKTGGERAEPEPATSLLPAPDVPADAAVFVVPGRKRYHIDSCRQLTGRDKEELTYVEAREEGFSPCTACMPDTALAARAAGDAKDKTAGDDAIDTSGTSAEPLGTHDAAGSDTADADTDAFAAGPGRYAASESGTGYGAASTDQPAATEALPGGETTVGHVRLRYPPGESAHEAGLSAGEIRRNDSEVRILAGTTRYHRPECALIEDVSGEGNADDLESLTASAAEAKGYTACLVCRPDREHARD